MEDAGRRSVDGPLTAVVAPLPEEAAGLLRRLDGRRRERREGLAAHVGSLGGRSVVVASTGDGPRNAARGLRDLLAAWSPDRVIVMGVAAGLTEDLEVGQVILAERVLDGAGSAPAPDRRWGRAVGAAARAGTVLSADRIAVTSAEKRAARGALEGGGLAVLDLESAAFARIAGACCRPFVVLRAVSDRLDETLPLDFNRFLGEGGGLRRSAVVRHLALRPHLIPSVMDLRRRVALCADRLADAVRVVVCA